MDLNDAGLGPAKADLLTIDFDGDRVAKGRETGHLDRAARDKAQRGHAIRAVAIGQDFLNAGGTSHGQAVERALHASTIKMALEISPNIDDTLRNSREASIIEIASQLM